MIFSGTPRRRIALLRKRADDRSSRLSIQWAPLQLTITSLSLLPTLDARRSSYPK
jgi:hypothetical protein